MNDERMQFWINNGYNVLFVGKHGVGKSSMVIDAFNAAGLKWKYFSASTMDPWVDFIGVPKEKKDGETSYLELIRPKSFQEDDVEAIFLDEFNRSPKKVRNAVMELIQFKSINGKKFNKLKIVWAAINPEDKEDDSEENDLQYDVEKLDPAQKDRFHIQVEIPYKPDISYFRKKYGNNGEAAVKWWHTLDKKIKNLISPRRLDYALKIFADGGDLSDVLPKQANRSELNKILANTDIFKEMEVIFQSKDEVKAKSFLSDANKLRLVSSILSNASTNMLDFWGRHVPVEHLSNAIAVGEKGLGRWLIGMATDKKDKWATSICKEIVKAKANTKAIQSISKAFKKAGMQQDIRVWEREAYTARNPTITTPLLQQIDAAIATNETKYSSSSVRNFYNLQEIANISKAKKDKGALTLDDAKSVAAKVLNVVAKFQGGTLKRGLSGAYAHMSQQTLRDVKIAISELNFILTANNPGNTVYHIAKNTLSKSNYSKVEEWLQTFIKKP